MSSSPPLRVGVIGLGPCGLATLNAFSKDDFPAENVELTFLEKQAEWGGLWNYSWRTGTDASGTPVHNSMYRHLWSNGPKECLELFDYSFDRHFGGKRIGSFPPREVLRDYLIGRAKKNLDTLQDQPKGCKVLLHFNACVQTVSFDEAENVFKVAVRWNGAPQRSAGTTENYQAMEFDHLIVATGHFSTPHVPEYKGFDQFPGRILHSHDFRDAEEFRGRRVVILGSSYSAEDIALQCHKYGASQVTVAYRHKAMGFDWPANVKEVRKLLNVQNNTLTFADGVVENDVDAIILCTGYLHSFPFIISDANLLSLETTNRLYPPGLYKGVVKEMGGASGAEGRLFYLGMQDQFYTFNMFDEQALFVRDLILKSRDGTGVPLRPSSETERAADIQTWVEREGSLADQRSRIHFQKEYCQDLVKCRLSAARDASERETESQELCDFFHRCALGFESWERHKEEGILEYRNKAFASHVTGTMAALPRVPWLHALDDSMQHFLSCCTVEERVSS